MTQPLGKLERVDLRAVWETEAQHFTPWLAQVDNLAILGDTIGIELELEAQEKDVGPFRADILCKDTASDRWVLIENQLERTDHTHLGQLLTYAAGLDAVTIIWISSRFADEHRATLDWLNDITDESFRFFGLEIELWKIGDSAKAPKFNIVVAPNQWSKSVTRAAQAAEMTESARFYQSYWQAFIDEYADKGEVVRRNRPSKSSWMSFAIGRTGFALVTWVKPKEGKVRVSLDMWGDGAAAHFRLLEQDRIAIDEEIGEPVVWDFPTNRKTKGIYIEQAIEDVKDTDNWPGQYRRFFEKLQLFDRVFRPRVKTLNADDWQPEPEEDEAAE